MASFQAKIGWKRLKKRENKNYCFVSFLPDGQQKIPKKQQKYSKIFKNTITASFQAKTGWKRLKKERKKKLSFRFVPTRRAIENSKKIAKFSKNSKIPLQLHFRTKQLEKG